MALSEYVGELRQDVGYALRLLRRAPGFAAVAIATLALGIGASTSMFTIVDAVLLRPLRFAEPQRLVMIQPTSGSRLSSSYLHHWRLQSRAFNDMAGWQDVRVNLTGRGEPLEVLADQVTSNFFAMLGTPAIVGRTFISGAELSHVEPEVVLSHGLWRRRFEGDPDVVGKSIVLDGDSFTVVGVMPDGFTIRTTELSESHAELWMPLRLVLDDRDGMGGSLNVVGRLAPGVTRDQAQADLTMIARQIEAMHPSYSRDWGVGVTPLLAATVRDVRLTLLVLFGAVGILLLITCTNVANLLSSRAARRQTELAIRSSLGASRGRLARQSLTESFVLAVVGGLLGVVLAVWGTQLLISVIPAGLDLPRTREIRVDLRILAFAFLVTVLTAVVFGLVPAIASARLASHPHLREATRGSSAGRGRNRLGSIAIVSQVALAVILLVGAGLLGRSFWKLTEVQSGFQPDQVLTMRTTLPASRYDSDGRIRAFGSELLERIRNLPGVHAVGFVSYLPMSSVGRAGFFDIEGRPPIRSGDRPSSWINVVGGRFFDAMGIPLLRGRFPGAADTATTEPVFVIDERLARLYWPDEDPIGRRLVWGSVAGRGMSGEIVGVVGSVRWIGVATSPQPTTYFWFPQDPGRELTIVARTVGNPADMATSIAAQVMALDPNQPVAEIRPMRDFVSADLARPRFTMLLLGGFAAAALLLAAIGVYGVIAFGVTQRTREIGVRIALGAERRDVLRLVMQRATLLIGTGLAIGIAAVLVLGRFVASLVYGITPNDPATLVAIAVFLAAVAILATYLPARGAARVDPMLALRAE